MIYRKKRVPTVTLERHVLHYLISNKVILQGQFSSCREEWFTNEPRFSIFVMIGKHFESSRNILTETQFEFELENLYPDTDDDAKKEDIRAEYKIIKNIKLTEVYYEKVFIRNDLRRDPDR